MQSCQLDESTNTYHIAEAINDDGSDPGSRHNIALLNDVEATDVDSEFSTTWLPVDIPLPVALVVNENNKPTNQVDLNIPEVEPEISSLSFTGEGSSDVQSHPAVSQATISTAPHDITSTEFGTQAQSVQVQCIFPEHDRFSVQASNHDNSVQASNHVNSVECHRDSGSSLTSSRCQDLTAVTSSSSRCTRNVLVAVKKKIRRTGKAKKVKKKDPSLLTFGDLLDKDVNALDILSNVQATLLETCNNDVVVDVTGSEDANNSVANRDDEQNPGESNHCLNDTGPEVDSTQAQNVVIAGGRIVRTTNIPNKNSNQADDRNCAVVNTSLVANHCESSPSVQCCYVPESANSCLSDRVILNTYNPSLRKYIFTVKKTPVESPVSNLQIRDVCSLAGLETEKNINNDEDNAVDSSIRIAHENAYYRLYKEQVERKKRRRSRAKPTTTTISPVASELRKKIIGARDKCSTVVTSRDKDMRGTTENMDEEHSLGMIIQCAVCQKDFQSLTALEDHMSAHDFTLSSVGEDETSAKGKSVDTILCYRCGKSMEDETELAQHAETCEVGETEGEDTGEEVVCVDDEDELISVEDVTKVADSPNLGPAEKSQLCVECGGLFEGLDDLETHVKTHKKTDTTSVPEVHSLEKEYYTEFERLEKSRSGIRSWNNVRFETEDVRSWKETHQLQFALEKSPRDSLNSRPSRHGQRGRSPTQDIMETGESTISVSSLGEITTEQHSRSKTVVSCAKNKLMNPKKGKQKHSKIDDSELLRKYGMTNVKVSLRRIHDTAKEPDGKSVSVPPNQETNPDVPHAVVHKSKGRQFKTRSQTKLSPGSPDLELEQIGDKYKERSSREDPVLKTRQKLLKSSDEEYEPLSKVQKCSSRLNERLKLEDSTNSVKIMCENSKSVGESVSVSDEDMLRKFGIKDVSICIDKLSNTRETRKLRTLPNPNLSCSVSETDKHLQLPWVVLRESDIPEKYRTANTTDRQNSNKPLDKVQPKPSCEQKVNKLKELKPDELDKLLRECGMGISVPVPVKSKVTQIDDATHKSSEAFKDKKPILKRSPSPQPSTSRGRTVSRRKRTARKSVPEAPDKELIKKYQLKEPRVLVKSLTKIEIALLKNPHSSFGKTNWLRHKFDSDSESDGDWEIPVLEANLEEDDDEFFDLDIPTTDMSEHKTKVVDDAKSETKSKYSSSNVSDEDLLRKFGLSDVKVVLESPRKNTIQLSQGSPEKTSRLSDMFTCSNTKRNLSRQILKDDTKLQVKLSTDVKMDVEYLGDRKCRLRSKNASQTAKSTENAKTDEQMADVKETSSLKPERVVKRKTVEAVSSMGQRLPKKAKENVKDDLKKLDNSLNSSRLSRKKGKSPQSKKSIHTVRSKSHKIIGGKTESKEPVTKSSHKCINMLKEMPKVKISVSCLSDAEIARYMAGSVMKDAAVNEDTVSKDVEPDYVGDSNEEAVMQVKTEDEMAQEFGEQMDELETYQPNVHGVCAESGSVKIKEEIHDYISEANQEMLSDGKEVRDIEVKVEMDINETETASSKSDNIISAVDEVTSVSMSGERGYSKDVKGTDTDEPDTEQTTLTDDAGQLNSHENITESTRDDMVGANAHRDDMVDADTHRDDMVDADTHRDDMVGADSHRDDMVDADTHRDDMVDADTHRDDMVDADTHRDDMVDADTHRDDMVDADAHKDDMVDADTHRGDMVGADSHRDDMVDADTHRDDMVDAGTHRDDMVDADTHRDDMIDADTHRDDMVDADTHKDDMIDADTHKDDKVDADTHKDDMIDADTHKDDMVDADTHKDDKVDADTLRDVMIDANTHRDDKVDADTNTEVLNAQNDLNPQSPEHTTESNANFPCADIHMDQTVSDFENTMINSVENSAETHDLPGADTPAEVSDTCEDAKETVSNMEAVQVDTPNDNVTKASEDLSDVDLLDTNSDVKHIKSYNKDVQGQLPGNVSESNAVVTVVDIHAEALDSDNYVTGPVQVNLPDNGTDLCDVNTNTDVLEA